MKSTIIQKRLILSLGILILAPSFVNAAGRDADTGSFPITATDFKSIFNQYRVVQAKHLPWAGTWWPYGRKGVNWSLNGNPSPAEKFDAHFKQGTMAADWENEHHSCVGLGIPPNKKPNGEVDETQDEHGCRAWWGHCNAWSAAAIKEDEPRETANLDGTAFTVADQKAYLTEMWMSSGAYFAGFRSEKKTDEWVKKESNDQDFRSFWDVSPRSMFLIFSNYLGAIGSGVVIDRYTGEQVWNQPVVGYRILPIHAEDILPAIEKDGHTLIPVRIGMKLYWANDGVAQGHLTGPFDIQKTSEDSTVEKFAGGEFAGRYLQFKFFFDQAPVMNEDGTTVVSAGNFYGPGEWSHFTNRDSVVTNELNHTHPDFIWRPTELDRGTSANPGFQPSQVYQIVAARMKANQPAAAAAVLAATPPPVPAPVPTPIAAPVDPVVSPVVNLQKLFEEKSSSERVTKDLTFKLARTGFSDEELGSSTSLSTKIKAVFLRENIGVVSNASGIETSSTAVKVTVAVLKEVSLDQVKKTLEESGYTLKEL